MAKSKQIKRTLVSTFITFLLCVAMLIGSTYAWFADNATVSVSKIQSTSDGTRYQVESAKDAEGNVIEWASADNQILTFQVDSGEKAIWTPGAAYSLSTVQIVNDGGMAIRYKAVVTAFDGDESLADALDVYVADSKDGLDYGDDPGEYIGTLSEIIDSDDAFTSGALAAGNTEDETESTDEDDSKSGEITLTLKLSEDVKDDLQNKSIQNIAITVYTTQCDERAVYEPATQVATLDKQEGVFVQIINAEKSISTLSLLDGETASETEEIEDIAPFDLDGVCSFRGLDELDGENPYADCHADFVVTANGDLEPGTLLMAAYSELFCDVDWLGWINDEKLIAGQQTRLLRAMLDEEYTVSYGELFENGEKFKCAVTDLGDNAGVTVRVELRLYEVADGEETGEFLVIGDYEHTF